MAGFILICMRDRATSPYDMAGLGRLALRLAPDNIEPHEPVLLEEDGVVRVVVNPVPRVRAGAHGVCLGALFEDVDWSAPLTPPPDGSYAIARHDARSVELLSDRFASRTMWYVLTANAFLASTSQRALASLLGSFEPCGETVAWMVSSGFLGPELGWDPRVRRVPPATCLRLDRDAWKITTTARPVEYHPVPASREEHVARLRDAVFTACRDAGLADDGSWMLPLSGGHDSRALLVGLLQAGTRPTCVTWGLASSIAEPGNDAFVARQLATHFGLDHVYCALDPTGEPMRDVLTRFLLAGEGRSIELSGYTDGMAMWKRLFDSGVSVVVRGDTPGLGSGQGRAYDPVSERFVRTGIGRAVLATDYPEGHLVRRLGLAAQHLPAALRLRPGETLGGYRDRMHNQHKVATMFAALNDPKCAYVEVTNPLLHRAVVKAVSELPDELRQWERGYAEMVEALVPGVPMDEAHAEAQTDDYLGWGETLDELRSELSTRPAGDALPRGARETLVASLERPAAGGAARRSLRSRVKAVLPEAALRLVPPRVSASSGLVALRAYVASRMGSILRDDASFGEEAGWRI